MTDKMNLSTNLVDHDEMPWTKREIIDAMIAEYRPFRCDDLHYEDLQTWLFVSQLRALYRLAGSQNAPAGFGRGLLERLQQREPVTEIENAVFARFGRVLMALRDGRDPNVAYDTPLRDEMH